jgi:uncharacterized membrane protein YphA (DoxX/SURF4 family)
LIAATIVADVARIALGAVLVLSGVAKVAAGTRWTSQAAGLGVPRVIAAALPWLELAVGAAVVSGVAEPWPAVAAFALIAAFTLWIAVHLARDEHPPCACFGTLSVTPLSGRHLARNGALLALAVVAISR